MLHIRSAIISVCAVIAILFLSGCGESRAMVSRAATDTQQVAQAKDAVANGTSALAAQDKVGQLTESLKLANQRADAAVADANGHKAKIAELQRQRDDIQASRDALDAQDAKVVHQLRAERDALLEERLWTWAGILGLAAALAGVAGFFLPAVSVLAWRLAIGCSVVASVLGFLAPLAGYYRWVGVAVLLGVLAWIVSEIRKHGASLQQVVDSFDAVRKYISNWTDAKAEVQKIQTAATKAVVDQLKA